MRMNKRPLISIIIPVHNQWSYTQLCLKSIRRFTSIPHEVIVINNASRDQTRVRISKDFPLVKVIHNQDQRGFSASMNQGIRTAKGDYFILLNNDTLPSYNWARNLIRPLIKIPRCGLVGPKSNSVIPQQKIQIELTKIKDIFQFSKRFNRHSQPNKWTPLDRLSGFCLALSRKAFKDVGFFDENYGMGYYEDVDYAYRVRLEGYQCILAGDTYVHHFGGKSFTVDGENWRIQLSNENREYFIKKWGRDPDLELTI